MDLSYIKGFGKSGLEYHLGRQPGFLGYSAVAERLAQLVCGGS